MKRRGFTLMEMVVVMAMLAMILMISSQILLNMWRTNAVLREQRLAAYNVARLSRQIREDAHAAADVVAGDNCEFASQERRVIYSAGLAHIARVEYRHDKVVARETFAVASQSSVSFRQREVAGRVFIQLEIKPNAMAVPGPVMPAEPLRIESLVGLRQLPSDVSEAKP